MEPTEESSSFLPSQSAVDGSVEFCKPIQRGCRHSLHYHVRRAGQDFFLKRLRDPSDAQLRSIYYKEYVLSRTINCPYIVKCHELVSTPTECSLWIEYIQGQTLTELLQRQPSYFASSAHLRKFLMQLLGALQCLHERSIVHLDVKPDNIMLTDVNMDVRLLDLGFSYSDVFQTTPGMTNRYAAPEQVNPDRSLDARTDIYCVGCVLQEIEKSIRKPLPSLYRSIKEQCLCEKPELRFQSVAELIGVIEHSRRKRIVWPLTFLLLLATGVGLLWWRHQHQPPVYFVDSHYIRYHILPSDEYSVEVVGYEGFNAPDSYDPTELRSVQIDDHVYYSGHTYQVVGISDSAFYKVDRVEAISIPPSVRSIGEHAFHRCNDLRSITIPEGVVHMGDGVFSNCGHLEEVHLPSDMHEVPANFLTSNVMLRHITLPPDVTIIHRDAFAACTQLREVCLPDGLKVIERGAFWNCDSLSEIHIPSQVTFIGQYTFDNCDGLRHIYNHSHEPQNIPDAFGSCINAVIHVPAASLQLYQKARIWCERIIVPI